MALIVEKYGGTSVGSVERINAVADNVAASQKNGDQMVVVVSAMSGETNRLLALADEINPDRSDRESDVLLSTGEQVTIALLSMALHARGVGARSYTGGQVRILTDSIHGRARILEIDSDRMQGDLKNDKVWDIWRIEGPTFVSHFRGAPHVHAYINVGLKS